MPRGDLFTISALTYRYFVKRYAAYRRYEADRPAHTEMSGGADINFIGFDIVDGHLPLRVKDALDYLLTMPAAVVLAATAVFTASVVLAVMMVMVVAFGIGIISKLTCNKALYCLVRISVDTAIELNACLGKCHLRTAANTAADQHIHIEPGKKAGKCAVSASIGVDHLIGENFIAVYGINLELLRVAEMLKNFTIAISYCDFHLMISFRFVLSLFNDFLNCTANRIAVKVTAITSAMGSAR